MSFSCFTTVTEAPNLWKIFDLLHCNLNDICSPYLSLSCPGYQHGPGL